MTDKQLIQDFISGDEDAFHILVARYQKQLFYCVKSIVLNSEDAKDITQETFIRAFNNLKRLKKKDSFKSWLFKIAMNLSKDHLRRKKEAVELKNWIPDEKSMVEKEVTERDLAKKIKILLKSMSPRQRMILSLYLFKEMKPKEIANYLDIKHETVRTNLHFGLKNLRLLIKNKGVA